MSWKNVVAKIIRDRLDNNASNARAIASDEAIRHEKEVDKERIRNLNLPVLISEISSLLDEYNDSDVKSKIPLLSNYEYSSDGESIRICTIKYDRGEIYGHMALCEHEIYVVKSGDNQYIELGSLISRTKQYFVYYHEEWEDEDHWGRYGSNVKVLLATTKKIEFFRFLFQLLEN